MSRVKYLMKAPDSVTESVIEGSYYWPDEDHMVEVTNPGHVAILKQHGYTEAGHQELIPPATAFGLIGYEEMGRSELIAALTERGVSFPAEATRAALEEAAHAWNIARKGPRRVGPEGQPEPTALSEPMAGQLKVTMLAQLSADDVATMDIKALRTVLENAGVAAPMPCPPAALRKIARDAIAKAKAA